MHGLMTECEWRKLTLRRKRTRTTSWGAQYTLSNSKKQTLCADRSFHAFLLILAICIAVTMPLLVPQKVCETFLEASIQNDQPRVQPRRIDSISYVFPHAIAQQTHTYTREQLTRGRMMFIDEAHRLPRETPSPNTMSIAIHGKGMVPVRNLQVKSGRDTITALTELFAALRARGINSLTVWEGTLSAAQQRANQEDYVRELMKTYAPDEAVALTLGALDMPGTGELQQEYTVELRFQTKNPDVPDERSFESTSQGQMLLQTAWRYGFVRSQPDAEGRDAFRFRWVGKAHATAMTYLDLSLEEYLLWLHEKGVLTIQEAGTPKYIILCKPMSGTHIEFSLPMNAVCEASLDNMGYAIVACTLE